MKVAIQRGINIIISVPIYLNKIYNMLNSGIYEGENCKATTSDFFGVTEV